MARPIQYLTRDKRKNACIRRKASHNEAISYSLPFTAFTLVVETFVGNGDKTSDEFHITLARSMVHCQLVMGSIKCSFTRQGDNIPI